MNGLAVGIDSRHTGRSDNSQIFLGGRPKVLNECGFAGSGLTSDENYGAI